MSWRGAKHDQRVADVLLRAAVLSWPIVVLSGQALEGAQAWARLQPGAITPVECEALERQLTRIERIDDAVRAVEAGRG